MGRGGGGGNWKMGYPTKGGKGRWGGGLGKWATPQRRGRGRGGGGVLKILSIQGWAKCAQLSR